MSFPADYGRLDRRTDAPIAIDLSASMNARRPSSAGWTSKIKIPRSWVGMSGYLAAGVFLGLVLILALSIGRGGDTAAGGLSQAPPVTDNIVRLHAREIGQSCWQGFDKLGPARVTIALEVGVDGKIRYVAASGETPAMRGCVEAHVRAWEFLPQSHTQTMALPFEIDRR